MNAVPKKFVVESIAQACHEMNAVYCRLHGDFSQQSWVMSPLWQKKSAINGVQAALDNPDITPAESHANWLAEKTADGWQYGEVKDVTIKTHPCMVDYDELPPEQKEKDDIFLNTVNQFRSYYEQAE